MQPAAKTWKIHGGDFASSKVIESIFYLLKDIQKIEWHGEKINTMRRLVKKCVEKVLRES